MCLAFARASTREFEERDAAFGDEGSFTFGINAFDQHGNSSTQREVGLHASCDRNAVGDDGIDFVLEFRTTRGDFESTAPWFVA